MALNDPLNIRNSPSKLGNLFNSPKLRTKAVNKLLEMRRETEHVQGAVDRLSMAIRTGVKFPNDGASRAHLDIRNWVLSLIESQVYMETLLGDDGPTAVENRVREAAKLGANRATFEFLE